VPSAAPSPRSSGAASDSNVPRPRAPVELRAEREAVRERAQHVDARERRHVREAPRVGTRRDHEAVEGHGEAAVEHHPPAGEVERLRALPELPVDLERGVLFAQQRGAGGVPLAGEHFLRERRPVVGRLALLADHRHAPRESRPPQRLQRAQPGERSAHHDHRVHVRHGGRR
jgi:hypothetical protein